MTMDDETSDALATALHELQESNRLQAENAHSITRLESLRHGDLQQQTLDRKRTQVLRFLVTTTLLGMAFGLVVVATLIVVAVKQSRTTDRIDCRSNRSAAFYAAEKEKVVGQVKGWHQQLSGLQLQAVSIKELVAAKTPDEGRDAILSYNRALDTTVAGLTLAIDKAEVYLTAVRSIEKRC